MSEIKLSDIFAKAPVLELDRPRRLAFTVLAWMHLEEVYGSMPMVLEAYKEMLAGKKVATHTTQFLWAMLQEEADDRGETLTIRQVRRMMNPAHFARYREAISNTLVAYMPLPPDPLTPTAVPGNPGSGGGPTHGVRDTSTGTAGGS